jgi:3-phenylpropionate/cinnamic acid dioxygenase small subunit
VSITTGPTATTVPASGDPAPGRADAATHFEVEQLYYREAELLDEGRFADWLDLFADDLVYWMPTRTNRLRRQQALATAARGEAAFYDETKESLAWRIRRFDSGMAWAEDPPSRTRHLVTNVRVKHANLAAEYEVRSNFLVYRNRLEREENVFAGERSDLLRQIDGHLLLAKNISTFF